MAANSRTASAVQILCVVAYKGEGGTDATQIAKSLQTNPVVVRKLLKQLEHAGLVTLRPGRNGGVQITQPPHSITLDRVHRAVNDADVLALRPGTNKRCPVSRQMRSLLTPVFAEAAQAVEAALAKTKLSALMDAIG